MKQPIRRGLLIALLLLVGGYAIAEEVNLTTFYPSPRGVFRQLRIIASQVFPGNGLELVTNANVTVPDTNSRVAFRRSRGTESATDEVEVSDVLGEVMFEGLTTIPSTYTTSAKIQVAVDAPRAGANIPSRMTFHTTQSGGAMLERMRINNAGSVGIGTTAPSAELAVAGAANQVTSIGISTPGTGANDQARLELISRDDGAAASRSGDLSGAVDLGWMVSARGNAFATAAEQNDLVFTRYNAGVSNNTVILDFPTGNIGLGNPAPSAPTAQIHQVMQGTVLASEMQHFTSHSSDAAGYGQGRIVFERTRNTAAAPAPVLNGDVLGEISFRGRSPGGGTLSSGKIQAIVDGVPTPDNVPTAIQFLTNPIVATGLTERMRITSSGNVGIGTVTPTTVASPGVGNLATGNLDVNDIWIRSAPPAGRWASQSTGGILMGRLDGGYSSRLFPGVGSVQVTTMQWVNCGFDNCPASGSGCALGPIGGTYIALLGTNPPGASCHAIQVDRPVDGIPGKAFMLNASCPPGWKTVSGGANSYKNSSDQVPSNALVSVPDTYQSFVNIPEDAGWVYDINFAPLAGNPPGSTEGWTTAAPKTSGYDGLQSYALCGGP